MLIEPLLTFDFITLQNFPKRLEQLLEVFSGTHATQIPHKHLRGVQRPSPRFLHHQIPPTKLSSIELPDGALRSPLALQMHKSKLSQHAAADHLAVRFEDGRQLLLGGVQCQVAHEELYCVALIHGPADRTRSDVLECFCLKPLHTFSAGESRTCTLFFLSYAFVICAECGFPLY